MKTKYPCKLPISLFVYLKMLIAMILVVFHSMTIWNIKINDLSNSRKQFYASRVEDEKQFSKINMRPGEYVLCIEYYGYTDQNELVEYTKIFFLIQKKITFNVETDY